MFQVPVCIQGKIVMAVVDTAAKVTIISDQLYESFKIKPEIINEVKVQTSGRELSLKAFIVGPATIQLGKREFKEEVYVAAIQDEMLLGLDFLRSHKINLNLDDGHLHMVDQTIPMILGGKSETPKGRQGESTEKNSDPG